MFQRIVIECLISFSWGFLCDGKILWHVIRIRFTCHIILSGLDLNMFGFHDFIFTTPLMYTIYDNKSKGILPDRFIYWIWFVINNLDCYSILYYFFFLQLIIMSTINFYYPVPETICLSFCIDQNSNVCSRLTTHIFDRPANDCRSNCIKDFMVIKKGVEWMMRQSDHHFFHVEFFFLLLSLYQLFEIQNMYKIWFLCCAMAFLKNGIRVRYACTLFMYRKPSFVDCLNIIVYMFNVQCSYSIFR